MTSFEDLKKFFQGQDYKFIIVSDAETRVHVKKGTEIDVQIPAGGVSIALDPIAAASGCIYISRGKTDADKEVLDKQNKIKINEDDGSYTLKRVFLTEAEVEGYYNGFSNQTIWPLCHVTFERPEFKKEWFEEYKRVNKKFADAIKSEIKGKTFIWINDYQLALVPHYLGRHKDVVIGMFWHIPWPTWEVFRILPYKKEILESMLSCNYLAFHRGYQARNFITTVGREFQARIDIETSKIYMGDSVTKVDNLPLGIDVDVIKSLTKTDDEKSSSLIDLIVKKIFKSGKVENSFAALFEKNKVILGVDRLDYTKGLLLRINAIGSFFKNNPSQRGKVVYLGMLAPSREKIPSYINLKKELERKAEEINNEHGTKTWKPIHLVHSVFTRKQLLGFYEKASVCLVTPRDDGMNLVSKEFVVSASLSKNPGMLVLSQFAGSAIDLTSALIVNPYDIEEVSGAIKKALDMSRDEKISRIKDMVENLEENNAYDWAMNFVKNANLARHESLVLKNK